MHCMISYVEKQALAVVLQKGNLKIFKNFPGKQLECQMVAQYEFAASPKWFSLADTFLGIFQKLSKLLFQRTATDATLPIQAGANF